MQTSLEDLLELAPDLTDDLLNTVDQPLQAAKDSQGSVYLQCDYNRDGDSYRSPWTNTYDPPIDDGILPNRKLRALEVSANDLFKSYLDMYYEGGSSSVYCWELDGSETAFAACVLFKKEVEVKKKGLDSGGWDAIHVAECRPDGKRAAYKLTSTIMLRMSTDHTSAPGSTGELNLSGSMTRQTEQTLPADGDASHLINMGRMVEDMENRMRDSLQAVYFGKTKSVVNGVYKVGGAAQEAAKDALAQNLRDEMARRAGS